MPSSVDCDLPDQRIHIVLPAKKLDKLDVSLSVGSERCQFGARYAGKRCRRTGKAIEVEDRRSHRAMVNELSSSVIQRSE